MHTQFAQFVFYSNIVCSLWCSYVLISSFCQWIEMNLEIDMMRCANFFHWTLLLVQYLLFCTPGTEYFYCQCSHNSLSIIFKLEKLLIESLLLKHRKQDIVIFFTNSWPLPTLQSTVTVPEGWCVYGFLMSRVCPGFETVLLFGSRPPNAFGSWYILYVKVFDVRIVRWKRHWI